MQFVDLEHWDKDRMKESLSDAVAIDDNDVLVTRLSAKDHECTTPKDVVLAFRKLSEEDRARVLWAFNKTRRQWHIQARSSTSSVRRR